MTRKSRQRSKQGPRESVSEARKAIEQIVALEGDESEIDPASQLFVEFAAPLLMTAETDQEFQSAVALAEFVWMNSHYDTTTQVIQLQQFIQEAGVPEEMVPWLLDVYNELAERKQALVG